MRGEKFILFIFGLFVLSGAWMTSQSWNGTVYVFVDDGDSRKPAAVSQGMDFSTLKGSDLSLASQKRVLQEARVVSKQGNIGLELGHFITRSDDGKRAFACQLYKKVEMKFIASGMAENGKAPVMYVESDCRIGESVNRIAPIWIPMDKLMAEKPKNMEVSFYEPSQVNLRFDYLASEWPLRWKLISLTLRSVGGGKKLHISDQEMLSLLNDKLITVSWVQDRSTASD